MLTRHERSLYLLCLGVLGHPEDAEDAVQETFFRALRSLSRFRGEAGVRTWLTRIAVNVCLEWKRRRRTKDAAERFPGNETAAPCPQETALNRLCVCEALAAVSPRGRAMLLLKEREGWTAGEIARTTHATERQVYYELQKAYQALAEWRRAHQDEEEQ